MSINIYKENDEITIIGDANDLEALGSLLITKSKLGDKLSAIIIPDNNFDEKIRIEIFNNI